MESKLEKQSIAARLALCVILSAGLYTALDHFGESIPPLSPCLPWLRKNKIQAIAIGAAALLGLSLLLLPPVQELSSAPPPPEEPCDPCGGYEQVCNLP